MPRHYWLIILTYILMQFSSFIGVPILLLLNVPEGQIIGLWSVISFTIGLMVILFLLKPDIQIRHQIQGRSTRGEALKWSIYGVFLAYLAQYVSVFFTVFVLGIEAGSENTQQLTEVAKSFPAFIFIMAIIGPILEEIVFRKVIFFSLYKRFNFVIGALVSSLIFAVVHWDFEFLLVYTALGFTFAYLYVKTKRIMVPIIAHVAMNTLAVLVNVVFGEQLEDLQQQLAQIHLFIGGFNL